MDQIESGLIKPTNNTRMSITARGSMRRSDWELELPSTPLDQLARGSCTPFPHITRLAAIHLDFLSVDRMEASDRTRHPAGLAR